MTDLLQARVGAERVVALKAEAKKRGMTLQAFVTQLVDAALTGGGHTGAIQSSADGVDLADLLAEMQRQTALLEGMASGAGRVVDESESAPAPVAVTDAPSGEESPSARMRRLAAEKRAAAPAPAQWQEEMEG